MKTEASTTGPHHVKTIATWQFQLGCKLFARRTEKPRLLLRSAGPAPRTARSFGTTIPLGAGAPGSVRELTEPSP
jgi:hypothetical protein